MGRTDAEQQLPRGRVDAEQHALPILAGNRTRAKAQALPALEDGEQRAIGERGEPWHAVARALLTTVGDDPAAFYREP